MPKAHTYDPLSISENGPARIRRLLLALLFAVACAGRPAVDQWPMPEAGKTDGEFRRGLWVRAASVAVPESIPRIMSVAHAMAITDLFVQVVVGGYAYYDSQLLPRSQYLSSVASPDYDPLDSLTRACAATPIRVHAWINALLVWSLPQPPDSATHIYHTHPEWFIRDVHRRSMTEYTHAMWTDRRLEGLYLDPDHPGVIDLVPGIIEEVVSRYPVDGIHLDFIRYPGLPWGLPETDEAALLAGIDASEVQRCDPRRYATWDYLARWQAWHAWRLTCHRSHAITRLIRRAHDALQATGPGADPELSAAVFADPGLGRYSLSQTWTDWPEGILLPVVMAYTPSAARFQEYLDYAMRHRTEILIGLGLLWPGMETTARAQELAAYQAGASGAVYFDFAAIDTLLDRPAPQPAPARSREPWPAAPENGWADRAFMVRPPARHVAEGWSRTTRQIGLEFAAYLLSLAFDPDQDLTRLGLDRAAFVDIITQDVAAFTYIDRRVFPLGDDLVTPPRLIIRYAFIDWREGDSTIVLERAGLIDDLDRVRLAYPASGDPLTEAAFAAAPHERRVLRTPAGVYVFVADTVDAGGGPIHRDEIEAGDLPAYLSWTIRTRALDIMDDRD